MKGKGEEVVEMMKGEGIYVNDGGRKGLGGGVMVVMV